MSETSYRIFGMPIRVSVFAPEGEVLVAHGSMHRVVEAMTRSPAPSPEAGERAVREALVGVFTHFPYTPELMLAAHRLVQALGLAATVEAEAIADAVLSRRAPRVEVVTDAEAMRSVLNKLTWAVEVTPADDPADATFSYPFTAREASALQTLFRAALRTGVSDA